MTEDRRGRAGWKNELKIIVLATFGIFISVSFAVTVTFLVFLRRMPLPEDRVREVAPFTFFVVVLVTVLFVCGYVILRYLLVIRPLRQINHVLDKIASGDFSERLPEEEGITNYAGMKENINRMEMELQNSVVMKTDFISNVSHELKTPVAVMSNYARLLQQDSVTDAERKKYAEVIADAAMKMNTLISNILRLNRLDNQKLKVQRTVYDLGEQLTDSLLMYEKTWEKKNIEPDIDLAEGVFVREDADLLSLVWNNLLSNAFKFTEPGGKVSVSLSEEAGCAVVKVSDTGCGMTEETGRHIFEKFYQGDTSRASAGNGLGLALVKRVMDLCGGDISIYSVLNEGSTFTVRLKTVPSESPRTRR